MDVHEVTQIMLVITTGLVFGRLGLALARRVERPRAVGDPAPAGDERVRALEEECALLRRELGELQERQDFTERLLLREPGRRGGAEPRVSTPH